MSSQFSIDRTFLEELLDYARTESTSQRLDPTPSFEQKLEGRTALQLVMLRQTLDHAWSTIPYYRHLMDQIGFSPHQFNCLKDLERLPVLTRELLTNNRHELTSTASTSIRTFRTTSGTTGTAIPILVTENEQECNRLWQQIVARGHNFLDRIILHIIPAIHGVIAHQSPIGIEMSAVLNVDAPASFRMDVTYDEAIIQRLFDTYPIAGTSGRIAMLRFLPPHLFTRLTDSMLRHGISPNLTSVDTVLLTGGLVTARHHQLCEQAWQATLKATYSCSELSGFATMCSLHLNRYHYDLRTYIEVLDCANGEPVEEGEDGLLVLTSLYPFQQAQPLLRYVVGDVVRRVSPLCECGFIGPSFEYRGRRQHCLDLAPLLGSSRPRRVLGTAESEDTLSVINEVPADLFPRFRSEVTRTGIEVDIEVVSMVGQEWADQLRARIRSELEPRLREMTGIPVPDVVVRLHKKGELQDYYRLMFGTQYRERGRRGV